MKNKPTLYIMCGLPFSGKTTLAKKLAKKPNFIHIDLDEIKFKHGFKNISDDDVPHEDWVKIFNEMYSEIYEFLNQGKNVIADMSNLEKSDRDKLRAVAKKGNFPTKVIYVKVPVKLARERWLKNKQSRERFDITQKIFDEAVDALEVPTKDENVTTFDEQTDQILI